MAETVADQTPMKERHPPMVDVWNLLVQEVE